jgi:diguanylate cyclase (GGDEF)-like protein
VHRLPAGEITIGRSSESVITIADHGLSRIHARLRSVPGGFMLTDGGSTNGSFIDDQRISAPTLITPGSRFRLGTRTVVSLTLHDELEETAALSVHEAALRDRLTGIYNRGVFDDRLRSELAFTKRHHSPLSIILFDIDFFKTFNDQHGHQVGDAVLIAVAEQVQTTVRTEDTLARYGGEEFVVIARDTSKDKALILAERIRVAVESCLVEGSGNSLSVTVSLGIATASADLPQYEPAALIALADRALYQAKRSGRNCIRHAEDLPH